MPDAGAGRGTGPGGVGDGGPAVPRHGAAQLTGAPVVTSGGGPTDACLVAQYVEVPSAQLCSLTITHCHEAQCHDNSS